MSACLTTLELPMSVVQKLDASLKLFMLGDLQKASLMLTEAYRSDQNSKDLFQDPLLRGAYLGARLPATFACLKAVLSTIDPTSCRSLLDLGAGPATTYGVLQSLGACFEESVCYEQSEALFNAGIALWFDTAVDRKNRQQRPKLVTSPLTPMTDLSTADLVVMSFFLGELPDALQAILLEKAWGACQKTLVILEPGTPNRFEKMRAYRENLIRWGGHIQAPCPHNLACPMTGSDWCHFSAKINRTPLHRLIKKVAHPFELEKYSYLIVSKQPPALLDADKRPYSGRLLRPPLKKSGHIVLDLCTQEGLQRTVVSKKDKAAYQRAKKYTWGEAV